MLDTRAVEQRSTAEECLPEGSLASLAGGLVFWKAWDHGWNCRVVNTGIGKLEADDEHIPGDTLGLPNGMVPVAMANA